MKDTPPEIEAIFLQMMMKKTPEERFKMATGMFEDAKALVLASFPEEVLKSPTETRCQLFLRFYGQDFSEEEREKILTHLRRKTIENHE